MIVKELKKQFINQLLGQYDTEEIESFFYMLTEHYLHQTRIDLALNSNLTLNQKEIDQFLVALNQLKKEIPIQYIIGEAHFFGLIFKVNQHTLIPRPETEELVDWILKHNIPKNSILDLGTGSGCIAIALKSQLTSSKVWALDISKNSLEVAKSNASSNDVDIQFMQSNLLLSTDNHNLINYFKDKPLDILVSNPPYVRQLEKQAMKANVLNNEPETALFVDDQNPLIFYNAILNLSQHILKPNGWVYFEINQYLGNEMIQLLSHYGLKNIELKRDFKGVHRMIRGQLPIT